MIFGALTRRVTSGAKLRYQAKMVMAAHCPTRHDHTSHILGFTTQRGRNYAVNPHG